MTKELERTEELRRGRLLQLKTEYPNLYRVVLELSKSKDPLKATNRLLSVIKSSPQDFADPDQNVSLTVR